MGLRSVTPIVVLILQLYGAHGYLPTLPGNRLLTGDATNIPGSTLIDCIQGGLISSDFHWKKTLKPSEALTDSKFRKYPFTAHTVVPNILTNGGVGRFSFSKVKHGVTSVRTAYALQVDGSGESAYWLPQGGFIDVPQTPTARDPKYVFTADYSGCSWTVTPMNNGMLRLRHVEGGHQNAQFNNLDQQHKGGATTYGMQYKDYGYIHLHGRLIEHATGFAYMQFSNGRWSVHVQHQTCAPRPGNFIYHNGHVQTFKMSYFNQNRYSAITGTELWRIPTTL